MQFDVVIIGGGLAGSSLALALKQTNLSIAVVEAQPSEQLQNSLLDARSIALSLASKQILATLDCWPSIQSSASGIKHIHVSKQGAFGITRLHASDHGLEAFGYVVEIGHLNQALQPRLAQQANIEYFCPAQTVAVATHDTHVDVSIETGTQQLSLQAKLLIAADGTQSFVRKTLDLSCQTTHYQQQAIIANIELNRDHHHQAFERFLTDGLIALLPMKGHRMSLVWAVNHLQAKHLLKLDDHAFLQQLQDKFGYRLGRFVSLGKRYSHPLALQQMEHNVHQRVIFIGNAAQTLHPVAGQGFNLGLRDAALLAETLAGIDLNIDINEPLLAYQAQRQQDKQRVIRFTDGLIKTFQLNALPLRLLQGAGLLLMELTPFLKHQLISQGMGYSNHNAKLICGIPLESP